MMRRKHVAQQRSLTSSAIDLSNPDERDQGREIKLNKNRKGRCSPDYKVKLIPMRDSNLPLISILNSK